MARPALKTLRPFIRPALIIFGLGTFLAVLGPFGSHDLPWPGVWLYWTGFIAFGGVFGLGLGRLLPRLFPQLPELSIYLMVAMAVSVPVTVGVTYINSGYGTDINWPRVIRTYGFVLVISSFVTSVVYVVDRLTGTRLTGGATQSVEPQGVSAALLDKLPVHLRSATLWSMSAEDHYLRVRTDQGEALILMRLSDAVTACEMLDGARTHRSWWVARSAVKDAHKGDGRGRLVLKDGIEAPVSRTYYPALRKAGWF